MLKKYSAIKAVLFKYSDGMYRKNLGPVEKLELERELGGLVQAAWRTDEIRRMKPTPLVGGR